MEMQKNVNHVFIQLLDSLGQLSMDQYRQPCKNLSDNTIGQHVRHIIEMFQCLENGYESAEVDYDKRNRDKQIETDKNLATAILHEIIPQLSKKDKPLFLLTYYNDSESEPEKIGTNYFREIAYNLEHTIHHMALIRVGLREMGEIPVDASYGVASSTIKYRKQCVQ
jgi:uncharacterized damage-inducible protein DinB